MFGKAAVWDTWLGMKKMFPPDKKQIGTEKNYQQYCVMNLVDKHAEQLKAGPTRIIMMAYRNNRDGFFNVSRHFGKTLGGGKVVNNATEFCTALLETAHVALVTGDAFGAPGYVRLSFATDLDTLKNGFDRIEGFLKG